MFESDDFDLDEDFLKDIGEKEEEYYSQRIEPEISDDPPSKRKKIESVDCDILGDITFDDEPDFARTSVKTSSVGPKCRETENVDPSSRKKKMLEIFKTNDDSAKSETAPRKPSVSSLSNENSTKSRKTLALEILRKGSSENLGKNKNSPQSKSNREKFTSEVEKNVETTNIISENDRNRYSCEKFKKPDEKKIIKSSKNILPKNISPKNRKISIQRTTLVRKFPGPAGLLPDDAESHIDNPNFLNNLDIREIVENSEDAKISDFCSQNTERLFTSGGWSAMLDDLPTNFLTGHEISTIKRSTREGRENSRVAFVAGVVHKIDNSLENPRLLLKDMTDTIEATMHSDIPLAHPNVIEPGVVVLLRDAGLLGFRGSQKFRGTQYHLMIAPRNVMAVYSEKKCLITSPWMESLKKTTKISAPNDVIDDESRKTDEDRKKKISSERNEFSTTDWTARMNHFESDDDDDDAFACFNLDDIEDSQTVAKFSESATKVSGKFGNFEKLDKTATREKIIVGDDEKKRLETISTTSAMNDEIREKPEARNDENSRIANDEGRSKKNVGISSKLLKFRSDDVSTPNASESTENSSSIVVGKRNSPENNRAIDESEAKTFGDDLLASDNDTEDEILSQLDVESIMTNYNARS